MPVRPALPWPAALLVVAVGAAGCTAGGTPDVAASPGGSASGSASASPAPSSTASEPLPAPTVSRRPLSAAGGACRLLTYDMVRRALGTQFDVAAASGTAATSQTCVLQRIGATAPDLTLTVTRARGVTAGTFRESYIPAHATRRNGVGRAAYSAVIPSASAQARVELGWLSASGRVFTLVHTVSPGAPANDRTVGRLANLARRIDR